MGRGIRRAALAGAVAAVAGLVAPAAHAAAPKIEAHAIVVELTPGLKLSHVLDGPSATLTDGAGNALAGQRITFTSGGKTVCTAFTNPIGEASCGVDLFAQLGLILGISYTATYQPAGGPAVSDTGHIAHVLGIRLL